MKIDLKKYIIRFINGEKKHFHRLEEYYNSRKEFDSSDPYEQYITILFKDGEPDFEEFITVKRKILRGLQ